MKGILFKPNMQADDSETKDGEAKSNTPMYPDYRNQCVFHACFASGKTFQAIVEYMFIVHETLVFEVSSKGLTMKGDDRPTNSDNPAIKESMFTDFHIPPTGFINWYYGVEDEDCVTPVPVSAAAFHESLKGSILVKESLILYILLLNVDFLYSRVVTGEGTNFKVDSSTKLLNTDALPDRFLQPMKTPFYDLTKPVVTFKTASLTGVCKDVKASKINEISIDFHVAGIMMHFGSSTGGRKYPMGVVNSAAKPVYTAIFKVKKRFETLAKLNGLCKHVSVFASRGKPVLFSFNINETGGFLNIYMVPEMEK